MPLCFGIVPRAKLQLLPWSCTAPSAIKAVAEDATSLKNLEQGVKGGAGEIRCYRNRTSSRAESTGASAWDPDGKSPALATGRTTLCILTGLAEHPRPAFGRYGSGIGALTGGWGAGASGACGTGTSGGFCTPFSQNISSFGKIFAMW